MALKKARVLRETWIDGQQFKPNAVVQIDEKQLKAFMEDGSVDASAAAVEYCEKELGAKAEKPGKAAADAAG